MQEEAKTQRYYATCGLGLFSDADFRHVGLHRTASYILGAPATRHPERRRASDGGALCLRREPEHDPGQMNPHGWRESVKFLREAGYVVICVDQKSVSFRDMGRGENHEFVDFSISDCREAFVVV